MPPAGPGPVGQAASARRIGCLYFGEMLQSRLASRLTATACGNGCVSFGCGAIEEQDG